MGNTKGVWLSLEMAEYQAIAQKRLAEFEGEDGVDELIRALGVCEVAARRWHMQEATKNGLIKMPDIEPFQEECADVFDD